MTADPLPAIEELQEHYAVVLTAANYWLDYCKDHAGEVDPGDRMPLAARCAELQKSMEFLCEHHGLILAPIEYEEGTDA